MSVSVAEQIEAKLRASLEPTQLEIINESSHHNVPAGSETHFKVVVVSRAFEGKGAVARHQLVYGVLADELKGGVHALTITPRTPDEWLASTAVAPSPPCLGGSKAETRRS
jgi:stress-induced morphogen